MRDCAFVVPLWVEVPTPVTRSGRMVPMSFNITGDPAADKVLDESPFALVVGMMLDQHI